MALNGRDGKYYDSLGDSLVSFSPDSRHVAYLAARDGNQFVVVDGAESKVYLEFLRGSRVIFDDPTHLHTLARRDDDQFQSEYFRVELELRP